MSNPTIKEAKEICGKHRARGVIIVHFDGSPEEKFGLVSYGQTKADCKNMANIVDQIFEKIGNGEIKV